MWGIELRRGTTVLYKKWKGFVEEENQWLPVENFVFHYSSELVRYVKEKGLGDTPVLQQLSEVEGEPDMIEAARGGKVRPVE